MHPPVHGMTCSFLINTVQWLHSYTKYTVSFVFSVVHIMLLPSQKPSSSYSLLKFVYVISRLVVHPLLRKILDPPLHPRQRAVSLFS